MRVIHHDRPVPRTLWMSHHLLMIAILVAVSLALTVGTPSAIAAPTGWTVQQLTSGVNSQDEPELSGDRISWDSFDGANWQVHTWKAGGSITPVTIGPVDHSGSSVSGDQVVWGSQGIIYSWSGGAASPVKIGIGWSPEVSEGRVVWSNQDDAGFMQVVTWEVGESSPTTLTTGAHDHYNDHVSGDRVVWDDNDGVFTWKQGDAVPTRLTTGTDSSRPRVSGDRVVWQTRASDFDGGRITQTLEVWTWKAGVVAPALVSNAGGFSYQQVVSGDRVAWVSRAGAYDQIVTRVVGDSLPQTLTTDAQNHVNPAVSGDRVVWHASDGFNYQVFTWNSGQIAPTQLTSNPDDHGYGVDWSAMPRVSGNRIVWVDEESGVRQIVTAAPTPITPPGGGGDNPVTPPADPPAAEPTPIATGISGLSVSAKPKVGKKVTFKATVSPGVSAASAGTTLSLFREETKTAKKKVKGKTKKVKVKYWRARGSMGMTADASGALSATGKPKYKGKWKMVVSYAGSSGYSASTASKTFTVK